jgi:hypothetical protein
LAERARIVLACLQGKRNDEVAREVGVRPNTVGQWRKRFAARGIIGLRDEPRSGKPAKASMARTFSLTSFRRAASRSISARNIGGTCSQWSRRQCPARHRFSWPANTTVAASPSCTHGRTTPRSAKTAQPSP